MNDPRSPENIPEPEPAFFAANNFSLAGVNLLTTPAASAVIGALLVHLQDSFDTSGEPLNKFP